MPQKIHSSIPQNSPPYVVTSDPEVHYDWRAVLSHNTFTQESPMDLRFAALTDESRVLFREVFSHIRDTVNKAENGLITPNTAIITIMDTINYYTKLIKDL